MVRITTELILQSPQYVNACRDREICFRGYRITVIENLGATYDQFNSIDFSDNDIRRLDGFPLLKKLNVLLLNNNSIARISCGLEHCIPNLEMLILTGNCLTNCAYLNALAPLKYLKVLSLMDNPVARLNYYRHYVIYTLPELKVLDYKKITMKEREAAVAFFKSPKGKQIKKRTVITAPKIATTYYNDEYQEELTDKKMNEAMKIREAIEQASSIAEINKLNAMLQFGKLPEEKQQENTVNNNGAYELMEEYDEEDEDNVQYNTDTYDDSGINNGDFSENELMLNINAQTDTAMEYDPEEYTDSDSSDKQ